MLTPWTINIPLSNLQRADKKMTPKKETDTLQSKCETFCFWKSPLNKYSVDASSSGLLFPHLKPPLLRYCLSGYRFLKNKYFPYEEFEIQIVFDSPFWDYCHSCILSILEPSYDCTKIKKMTDALNCLQQIETTHILNVLSDSPSSFYLNISWIHFRPSSPQSDCAWLFQSSVFQKSFLKAY